MASIRKRTLTSGQIVYYVRYWLDGRKVEEKVGSDRGQAERRKEAVEQRRQMAKAPPELTVDVPAVLEAYYTAKAAKWDRDGHGRKVRAWAEAFFKFMREARSVEDLTRVSAEDIEAYRAQRLAPVNGRAPSRVTVGNELRAIKTFFTWAAKRRYLAGNPFDLVEAIGVERRRLRVLSAEEMELAYTASKGTYLHGMYLVGVYAGLRLGEIVALDIEHVRDDCLEVWATKTDRERRVPLTDRLADWVDRVRGQRAQGPLILNSARHRLNFKRTEDDWQHLMRLAALRNVTPHVLRHTFASHLLAGGANVVDVARWLGHARTSTTVDRYGHYIPGRPDDVNLLPGTRQEYGAFFHDEARG